MLAKKSGQSDPVSAVLSDVHQKLKSLYETLWDAYLDSGRDQDRDRLRLLRTTVKHLEEVMTASGVERNSSPPRSSEQTPPFPVVKTLREKGTRPAAKIIKHDGAILKIQIRNSSKPRTVVISDIVRFLEVLDENPNIRNPHTRMSYVDRGKFDCIICLCKGLGLVGKTPNGGFVVKNRDKVNKFLTQYSPQTPLTREESS